MPFGNLSHVARRTGPLGPVATIRGEKMEHLGMRMAALATLLVVILAAGCASIVDGSSQSLSVKTIAEGAEISGAQCTLNNNKGTWFVTTPGTVTVHRSYDAMNIKCTHQDYQPSMITSTSSTKGMAFGNILFGGLIGAGVDMGTGAAYDYPTLITVPLTPLTVPNPPVASPPASPTS